MVDRDEGIELSVPCPLENFPLWREGKSAWSESGVFCVAVLSTNNAVIMGMF